MKNLLNRFFARTDLSLTAAWTFNQLAYAIVYPFIPVYLSNERQIPYSSVGLIFPLLGAVTICSPLINGPLTDRCSRSFMILFGQFARGVCFLILAGMTYFNAPFLCFVVLMMINTGVGGAFQVGADAYLSDITLEEERPKYYSKIRIGYNLGWALGPMIGAFFANVPFWSFFIVTACLCFAGGCFTRALLAYNKSHLVLPEKKADLKKKNGECSGSVVKYIFSNRQLMLLLSGIFLLFCLTSQLYSTLSVFSTRSVGVSKTALGMIFSMNAFLVILLQIPVTNFLVKYEITLKIQLLLGTLLYIAGYFMLGFCLNAWMIAGCVAVLTFGEMIIQPAVYSAATRECSPENTGRVLAAFSTFRGAGYAIGPWFGAQFFEKMSSNVMLWGALSAFAAAAFICFLFLREKRSCPEAQ